LFQVIQETPEFLREICPLIPEFVRFLLQDMWRKDGEEPLAKMALQVICWVLQYDVFHAQFDVADLLTQLTALLQNTPSKPIAVRVFWCYAESK
jgi:hypothetical protein